jgi:hypothetical protein
MNDVNDVWILKPYLRHVSVQVYNSGTAVPLSEASYKWLVVIYKILQSSVASLYISIKYNVQILQVFKNLFKIWLNISYIIKYHRYIVKLLLLRFLVETSSKVASYVQAFGGHFNPKCIRSVCLCCVVCQCHQDNAVFCFVYIILHYVRNVLIIF